MGEVSMDEFVAKLQCTYRQMVPLKLLLESCKRWQQQLTTSWTCLECQEKIFNSIINDSHSKSYPPLHSYTTRFLRLYIDEIEIANNEVYEDLLEKYLSLIHATTSSSICYKSYTLPCNNVITIQISTQYNEVGMVTWDASFLLGELVMSNPDFFMGKKVLELGSGVGLVGIILAKFTRPKQITLTDHASPVLQNLIQNLTLNGYTEESCEEKAFKGINDFSLSTLRESMGNMNENSVCVRLLEWFECVASNSLPDSFHHFDVIVAADVVYALDLATVVPKLLSLFFSINPQTIAIIAVTIRNEETYNLFMAQLQVCKLAYDDVANWCKTSSIMYDRSSVVIMKIYPVKENTNT